MAPWCEQRVSVCFKGPSSLLSRCVVPRGEIDQCSLLEMLGGMREPLERTSERCGRYASTGTRFVPGLAPVSAASDEQREADLDHSMLATVCQRKLRHTTSIWSTKQRNLMTTVGVRLLK